MKKVLVAAAALAGIALLMAFAIPTNRIKTIGWLRGERFHNGMPLHYWLAGLDSSDNNTRYYAMLAVAHDRDAVPALTQRLKDELPLIRHMAAVELANFGPEARDATPALVAMLKDDDRACRQAAEDALKKIDPEALAKARAD
jgi:hypothetical protein